MKVLVLTNMYPTEDEPGSGAFVFEQVEGLRALGLSMDVLPIQGPLSSKKKYLRGLRALRQVVADRAFDVVHAHYGLSGAVALAQRRFPVVTTFHGSDTGYVSWQRRVSWAVARLATPIFVTQEGAARLRMPGAPVIPCGIDLDRFRPIDRREARRRLGWDETRSYVLLPGTRRDAVKRADLFDAVLERARREVTDLVGVSLEQEPRDRVALMMSAVDVTLLTSDSEGSPVAIKESLACSTPVVSVPVGDVPSLVARLPGCAVAERDTHDLARAVVTAMSVNRSPELRERVLPYAQELVAKRVVEVYEGVVANRERRSGVAVLSKRARRRRRRA